MRIIHKHKWLSVLILTVIVGLFFVAATVAWTSLFVQRHIGTPVVLPIVERVPIVRSVESRLLVVGDVFFGRYINKWSLASEQKYAYPFQRLSEFERSDYDAWVANMECPITNNPKVSPSAEEATLKFDCSPEYLTEANKWFTAVSLANNHTDNQGTAGYMETKQHLNENSMQYFGAPDPDDYDNLCDVLRVPARITMSNDTEKQGILPLIWCGYNGVFEIPDETSLRSMTSYTSSFTVVAMPHSGAEYKAEPDRIKTTLYRAMIDAGADVVIGNHAHWVQTSEAYKGHLIVYSLGNFIFDQQQNSEVMRSAVLSVTASVNATNDIDKWLALGESCVKGANDCLGQVTEQHLTKLPTKLHFAVLGSSDAGKVTHRASEAELVTIKQRLQWQTTIAGLTGDYSGE